MSTISYSLATVVQKEKVPRFIQTEIRGQTLASSTENREMRPLCCRGIFIK